jgi:hypothetical protein
MSSEEFEEGTAKFLEVVKGLDATVEVVIPVTPSRGNFLISLTRGKTRKFISVAEDDILDLPQDTYILQKITGELKTAIAELPAV